MACAGFLVGGTGLSTGWWSWVLSLWWAGPCQGVCVEVAVSSVQFQAACLLIGGAVFHPCWLFGLGVPPLEPAGCWVGPCLSTKMATSRRAQPINIPWSLHHQCPCPHSEPHPTPTSPVDPPRSSRRSSPGSYGVTSLCWVLVHVKSCVHPQEWNLCFLQSCGAPALKSCRALKPNALGAPPPNASPPGWGA